VGVKAFVSLFPTDSENTLEYSFSPVLDNLFEAVKEDEPDRVSVGRNRDDKLQDELRVMGFDISSP
jgi:hypothetical protein